MRIVLDGCVTLVTGGTRGVGRGIASVLLDAGATVVVCARSAPARLHDGFEFKQCDVRDPNQVMRMVDEIANDHGGLDILVNNAGGTPFGDAATTPTRHLSKLVELNLLAPLYVAQAANAVMQSQGGGSIVNVSSVSGHRPSPGTAAYGAAKAGLDSLTASLAVEWAPKVRVNSVVAGMVRTEQAHLHYGDRAGVEAVARTVPLQRLAEPEDIGRAVAFLASELSSYISGATLLVHGGGEVPAFLGAATAQADAPPAIPALRPSPSPVGANGHGANGYSPNGHGAPAPALHRD